MAFHDYQGDVSKILSRAQGSKQRCRSLAGSLSLLYGSRLYSAVCHMMIHPASVCTDRSCPSAGLQINKWARVQGGRCDNCSITRAMQDAYMKQVLGSRPSDAVFRYAWYSAR